MPAALHPGHHYGNTQPSVTDPDLDPGDGSSTGGPGLWQPRRRRPQLQLSRDYVWEFPPEPESTPSLVLPQRDLCSTSLPAASSFRRIPTDPGTSRWSLRTYIPADPVTSRQIPSHPGRSRHIPVEFAYLYTSRQIPPHPGRSRHIPVQFAYLYTSRQIPSHPGGVCVPMYIPADPVTSQWSLRTYVHPGRSRHIPVEFAYLCTSRQIPSHPSGVCVPTSR